MPAPSQGRLLTPRSDSTLLRRIESLFEAAEEQSSSAKLESNWQIGRSIQAGGGPLPRPTDPTWQGTRW